jgi:hypothetical protein
LVEPAVPKGPEHQVLANYAAPLRVTGCCAEANKQEARAKAIRAKYD